jgi:hypothetical protein
MELETNTSVSDDARLLAQAKKLTLQPVHADVSAEDLPDSVVVAQHINGAAVANLDIDTEQNIPAIIPLEKSTDGLPTDRKALARLYILTAIGFVLLAAVVSIVIVQL